MAATRIFKDSRGCLIIRDGHGFRDAGFRLDDLFAADDPAAALEKTIARMSPAGPDDAETIRDPETPQWQPPIESQEVWGAGVTYLRSRTARMEEAEGAGGGGFYDRVYDAPRPELFFKATPRRVRGHRQPVGIRSDSSWNVPEPELTLAISASGKVFGFTIGNDQSSRDIEGDNPLYLPQAKTFTGSCALGPSLVVGADVGPSTGIRLEIHRGGRIAFSGETEIAQMKRSFAELADYLFRENDFPAGCYLMTGTGIVPESDFSLQRGDTIRIAIDGLGALQNSVA